MKRLAILLGLAVLVAGCTGQTFPGLGEIGKEEIKKLQEVKDFIKDYPNAEINTALYTPNSVKSVLPEFKDECPSLGEEGKSYSKVVVRDPDTNRGLIVWVDEDNKVICSLSAPLITVPTTQATTTLVTKKPDGSSCLYYTECASGYCINNACNTPGAAGTTTSSSTTTTAVTTTTAPTTTIQTTTTAAGETTTTANTTTTTIATTTTAPTTTTTASTTSTTTTTTTAPKPDLYISTFMKTTNSTHWTFSIIVTNGGNAASVASNGGLNLRIWTAPSNTSQKFSGDYTINAISAGSSQTFNIAYYYPPLPSGTYNVRVYADLPGYVSESVENNNERSMSVTK